MSDVILEAGGNGVLFALKVAGVPQQKEKYFFMERELHLSKENAIKMGLRRHVKIAKNKESGKIEFLDYCGTKRFYGSLGEWMEVCNSKDVLYGRNEFDGKKTYITLQELLLQLKPEDKEVTNLGDLFARLTTNSVRPEQIFVKVTTLVRGDKYLAEH